MINDRVSDTLIRIKNGYLARKNSVLVPYSKIGENLIRLLVKNKFILSSKVVNNEGIKEIAVDLLYNEKQPAISNVVKVSKPSSKVYVKSDSIPKIFGGLGVTIISTPKGLMTGETAKKEHLGGELLCKIW